VLKSAGRVRLAFECKKPADAKHTGELGVTGAYHSAELIVKRRANSAINS
jgi:hypothetical protein